MTFATFPIMILAGLGLEYIKINLPHKNYLKLLFYIIVILIIGMAISSGSEKINSIKPTSSSDIDIANWFHDHGDKHRVVVDQNYELDPIIVSIARQTVVEGGYSEGGVLGLSKTKYIKGNYTLSDILDNKIGYMVLQRGSKSPPYFALAYENQEYDVYAFKND